MALPSVLSGIIKHVENFAGGAGQAVGNQQILPGLPGSSTIGEAVNTASRNMAGGTPSQLINDFNNSPLQAAATGNFGQVLPRLNQVAKDVNSGKTQVMFGLGVEDPAKIKTGDKLVRDMRFKQGNPETNYKAKSPVSPFSSDAQTAYGGKASTPIQPFRTVEETKANARTVPPTTPPKPNINQDKGISPRQSVIQDLTGLDNYQLPASTFGKDTYNLEQVDKNVMANDIGGNSFDAILKNAKPAYNRIWKQAIQSAKNNPDTLTLAGDVDPHLQKYIQPLVDDGLIDPGAAANHLTAYKARLVNSVNSDLPNISVDAQTPPININDNISPLQLFHLKTGANKLADSAYDNNGQLKTNLTPQQLINVALRNGMDDALTTAAPDVKNATMKLNSIERISRNISPSLRNQTLNLGKIPGTNIGIPASGMIRKGAAEALGGNPLIWGPAGIIGGAILANSINSNDQSSNQKAANGGGNVQNQEDNNVSSIENNNIAQGNNPKPSHNGSVQNSMTDVNSLETSPDKIKSSDPIVNPAAVSGPDGKTIAMSGDTYKNSIAQLESLKQDPYYQYGPGKGQIDAAEKTLGTKYAETKPLVDSYENTNQLDQQVQQARKLLQKSSPQWFDAISLPIIGALGQNIQTAMDPNYRDLINTFNTIEAGGPHLKGKLSNIGNRQTAEAALDNISKLIRSSHNNVIKTFLGGQQTAAPVTPADQTPNGLPVAANGAGLPPLRGGQTGTSGSTYYDPNAVGQGMQLQPLPGQ